MYYGCLPGKLVDRRGAAQQNAPVTPEQAEEKFVDGRIDFGKGTVSNRAVIIFKGLTAWLEAMPFPKLRRREDCAAIHAILRTTS